MGSSPAGGQHFNLNIFPKNLNARRESPRCTGLLTERDGLPEVLQGGRGAGQGVVRAGEVGRAPHGHDALPLRPGERNVAGRESS